MFASTSTKTEFVVQMETGRGAWSQLGDEFPDLPAAREVAKRSRKTRIVKREIRETVVR